MIGISISIFMLHESILLSSAFKFCLIMSSGLEKEILFIEIEIIYVSQS